MPSEELELEVSGIFNRVVAAWIEGTKEESRMAVEEEPLFKPLITWPPSTEQIPKVSLPKLEPLETRITRQVIDVFSIYDLKPCYDTIKDLVSFLLKNKA